MTNYIIEHDITNCSNSNSQIANKSECEYWPGTNLQTVCVESDECKSSFSSGGSYYIEYKSIDSKKRTQKLIKNSFWSFISTFDENNLYLESIKKITSKPHYNSELINLLFIYNDQYLNKKSKPVFEKHDLEINKKIFFDEKITIKKTNINQMKPNFQWLHQNSGKSEYKGKWVAIENGIFLDYASTYKEILTKLEKSNIKNILVTKII